MTDEQIETQAETIARLRIQLVKTRRWGEQQQRNAEWHQARANRLQQIKDRLEAEVKRLKAQGMADAVFGGVE